MSLEIARDLMCASKPVSPAGHLLRTAAGSHVFLSNGSQLFDADAPLFDLFKQALAAEEPAKINSLLARLGLDGTPLIDDAPVQDPPLQAISLAIAQKCNLGCTYCYAEQGSFGTAPRNMDLATALAAIDLLIGEAAPASRINVAFLGGEPLVNRKALQAATLHAVREAERAGLTVGFSITTNGTLLTPEDAAFFEAHGFAVTISLDGQKAQHDALRPYLGGRGSFDTIMARVGPLLAAQKKMQVAARVTVTPDNLDLPETLDHFVAAGFHSVGFSPMLASPTGQGEMQREDLERMLAGMIGCGAKFELETLAGRRYPFANMLNALKEIGKGTHRPYPCGAGAGYLGVGADGTLAACHRFVGDDAGAMGSLSTGPDRQRRNNWLEHRHVHRQAPCNACWARYLCGGGCHHEVINRGRPACDFIRGWLHYCLGAYLRLADARPVPESA
jgi:uncharacterized protein